MALYNEKEIEDISVDSRSVTMFHVKTSEE